MPQCFISIHFSLIIVSLIRVFTLTTAVEQISQTNVVLIVAEDMGRNINSYQDHTIETPNLSKKKQIYCFIQKKMIA